MRIVLTNQFLTKCNIVGSNLQYEDRNCFISVLGMCTCTTVLDMIVISSSSV